MTSSRCLMHFIAFVHLPCEHWAECSDSATEIRRRRNDVVSRPLKSRVFGIAEGEATGGGKAIVHEKHSGKIRAGLRAVYMRAPKASRAEGPERITGVKFKVGQR